MKITTRIQYGLRLMINLGLNYGKGQILLKDIAAKEDISEKYLSQIIIPLKASGLLKSFRGAKGGYILGKPLKQISVKSIIEAVDGPVVFAVSHPESNHEISTSGIVTKKFWNETNQKLTSQLESVTLADMVNDYIDKEEDVLNYVI